ncbi:MAG: rane-bound metal-dependent hydrolase [Deltaproteobacteria bacterium]|nr:rane-bound metal-dependent hydrolase [Deltaproteobacteria bacterium]
MDTVTHGLTGWLVARALPDGWKGEHPAAATAVVALGSVLPDADNAASLLGSELYLRVHRGLSHSLLGISVSSLVLALLFARFGKCKDAKRLFLLALLGQLTHVVLDLLNAYGTQVLQPFSDARLSLDLLFVVDLLFSGIVVAGIALSRGGRAGRARVALVSLAMYVGVAALLHGRAVDIVRDAAVRSGVRVVTASALPQLPYVQLPPLERFGFSTPVVAAPMDRRSPGPPREGENRAVPFPAGPLAWNGFVDDGRTFLRAEIEPLTETLKWKQRELRGPDVPEVRALRGLSDVKTYLWFARFPAASVTSDHGRREVTFYDMRFSGMPGRGPFLLRVVESPGAKPRALWGH